MQKAATLHPCRNSVDPVPSSLRRTIPWWDFSPAPRGKRRGNARIL